MKLTQDRFPDLQPERMAVVVGTIVSSRDLVAAQNKPFSRARWGLGCLGHQVAMQALEALATSRRHTWLRFLPEQGMAFTLMIGSTPLRVQSDSGDVRPVMPGEHAAWNQLRLGFETEPGLLRLEVSQRAGEPVDSLTLKLYEQHTDVELESWVLFDRRRPGAATTSDQTPPRAPQAGRPRTGVVVPLTSGKAADVDTSNVYSFPANEDDKDAEG